MAKKNMKSMGESIIEPEVETAFREQKMKILHMDLIDEMKKSFIDYSMSVITDRALPDVRDGLKPVHRRILYSMFDQGFTPDKAYRKCATTVGDVLGRFHPHGDAAVYDTMVRLAQTFSMRYPLVDGHGNFGSRDGDSAAAYRYTEARLCRISMEMMSNIRKDTVNFRANFDDHHDEPEVLPASFPNLLVNGSTGIAVGMTTNIPPHNLTEVIDATVALLNNPEMSIEDLRQIVKGPDFPTYGEIMGTAGIRKAYSTGRGSVVVRGRCEIEELRGGRHRIIVRDLPYMVNKARLIEQIADLVKSKTLDGISNVRDESDRNEEIRIVIDLKKDATPGVVLNRLYKHSRLQDSFSINMLALIPQGGNKVDLGAFEEGKEEDPDKPQEQLRYVPRIINLKEALNYYIVHAKEVRLRRTLYELKKARERKHIVEGLRIAIDQIDRVIDIIRSSKNDAESKPRLCAEIGLTEIQAQSVVDMRLGRLSGLEREKLKTEFEELCKTIEELEHIINDDARLREVISEDLQEIKGKYGDERRTIISPDFTDIDDESLIENAQIVVAMSNAGYIKRMPIDEYQTQHRGGRGIKAMRTREEDFAETVITTETLNEILFFSDKGKVYSLKAYMLPEVGRQGKGTAIVNLIQLEQGEKITGIIPISEYSEDASLIMVTESGRIKKTRLSDFSRINRNGLIAVRLAEGDHLVGIRLTEENSDIIIVTAKGKCIRFDESGVRSMGRQAAGVRGIRLNKGDSVIGMVSVPSASEESSDLRLVTVTEEGYGKSTELADIKTQNRGGSGLFIHKLGSRTGDLVGVGVISEENDLLLINDAGIIIRLSCAEIPVLTRITIGVKLMRIRERKVVDICVVDHEDEEEQDKDKPEEEGGNATVAEAAAEDAAIDVAAEDAEDAETD